MRSILCLVGILFPAVASVAASMPCDVFVARARELYPTKPYRAMTNTLMHAEGFGYHPSESNDVPSRLVAETPTTNHVRWCNIPYLRNVRDIGGWTGLRTGRAYRGSYLFRAPTDAGIVPQTAAALRKLHIKTDLDLRLADEYKWEDEAMPDLSCVGLVSINRPITAYMRAFTDERESFRRALLVFADPANYPVYFHCKAGADRTGTLAFVLEGLCGASEVDLQIDYELTTIGFDYRSRNGTYMSGRHSDCIHWMLDTVKSYPGKTLADQFANCATTLWGLTDAQIKSIRAELMK